MKKVNPISALSAATMAIDLAIRRNDHQVQQKILALLETIEELLGHSKTRNNILYLWKDAKTDLAMPYFVYATNKQLVIRYATALLKAGIKPQKVANLIIVNNDKCWEHVYVEVVKLCMRKAIEKGVWCDQLAKEWLLHAQEGAVLHYIYSQYIQQRCKRFISPKGITDTSTIPKELIRESWQENTELKKAATLYRRMYSTTTQVNDYKYASDVLTLVRIELARKKYSEYKLTAAIVFVKFTNRVIEFRSNSGATIEEALDLDTGLTAYIETYNECMRTILSSNISFLTGCLEEVCKPLLSDNFSGLVNQRCLQDLAVGNFKRLTYIFEYFGANMYQATYIDTLALLKNELSAAENKALKYYKNCLKTQITINPGIAFGPIETIRKKILGLESFYSKYKQ